MILGIDPGLTGAVALMAMDGTSVHLYDTPSFVLGGKRRDYDVPGMVRLLIDPTTGATGHIEHVFIERQQSRPGAAVQAVFKIGYGFGLWVGILSAFRVPHSVVSPQVWQREMYAGAVGEGKERSLLIASRLYPGIVIPKDRHDRADALLIAEWGRRTLLGKTARWEEVGT